jgi:hypothetical protein
MSNANLERFKTYLANVPWDEVLAEMDVDACYNKFWDIYKTLYDLNFPLTTIRFNKNIHRISTFMTEGLLVSRRNKIKLLKMYLVDRTDPKKSIYVEYRNLYNKLVRASKKLHISQKLSENAKNPKKSGRY